MRRIGPLRGRPGVLSEYRAFLGEHKRWWLVPLIVAVLLLGALLSLTQGSPLAPLMYTVF